MAWKDYFYFQKGDQIAIILLLILITLSGGVYLMTLPKTEKENVAEIAAHLPDSANSVPLVEEDISDYDIKESTPNRYYSPKLKKGETIELNTADTTALKMIPGIGSGYSNRIVKYRNLLGGFTSVLQLKEVWGLDDELYEKVTPYFTLVPNVRKISVNNADFKELNKHPYIDYKQAKVIVDIRERKGRIESPARLGLLDEFSEGDIKKLTPYLSFD